jgi:hypothetical protein
MRYRGRGNVKALTTVAHQGQAQAEYSLAIHGVKGKGAQVGLLYFEMEAMPSGPRSQ